MPVSEEELRRLELAFSCNGRVEEEAVQRAKDLLEWALQSLGPSDRLAFSLLYLEELSMKEVAEILDWSLAQVKIRSFRSRRKLRTLLQKQGRS
jgi:RNA polymerase sigma-70 factor, ECF subfamily